MSHVGFRATKADELRGQAYYFSPRRQEIALCVFLPSSYLNYQSLRAWRLCESNYLNPVAIHVSLVLTIDSSCLRHSGGVC